VQRQPFKNIFEKYQEGYQKMQKFIYISNLVKRCIIVHSNIYNPTQLMIFSKKGKSANFLQF